MIHISLFLLNTIVFAQKDQFFVQTGSGYNFGGFAPISQHIGGGYYFKDGISVEVKTWNIYFRNYFGTPETYPPLNILNIALDVSYRPLKNKILSPAMQATFGLPAYSNANGKFIEPYNYYIIPSHPENPDAPIIYIAEIFNKAVYNYSLKLFADFKIKHFGIQFGPTLNRYAMKFTNIYVSNDVNGIPVVNKKGTYIHTRKTWGIELNLLYYFK